MGNLSSTTKAPSAEMNHIDYGLSVISASVLQQRSADQQFDLADVYHDLSLRGLLAGLEVYDRFYEIGSHAGLKETEEYFLALERA